MKPLRVRTISEFHKLRRLPAPAHRLISVVNLGTMAAGEEWADPVSLVFDFYSIAIKHDFPRKTRYGQQEYDFDEGVMSFMAPGQVFGSEPFEHGHHKPSGWLLLVHPDFLWGTSLAKTIKNYEFFDYSVHEALFLSEQEETTVTQLVAQIEREFRANIDVYSQDIIVAQLDLLLTYAQRFYHRQFLTRQITNHRILEQFEDRLTQVFSGTARTGLPTVQSLARELNISPGYLSELLTVLTGKSTQQHIHDRLIEKAKEELSTTDLSVTEIAFRLGFEHSQSFSKLFKQKTQVSPLAFRKSVG